jgi:hypothetical protein
MATITIQGLDELQRILGDVASGQTLRRPMLRSMMRLQSHMGDYGRSLGSPVPSYVRGRGPTNAAGVVTRLTSQNLGKRWTTDVTTNGGNVRGTLGNVVSYGPYVHDAEQQAGFHAARGALTDVQVLADEEGWITTEFERTVQAVCDGERNA